MSISAGSDITAADGANLAHQAFNYAVPSGGSDAYAITVTPAPTAYAAGQVFKFKADVANTGAATLNVNSLGAKTIKKNKDETLADGDIQAGQIVECIYDGTDFQIVNVSNKGRGETDSVTRALDTTYTNSSGRTMVVIATTLLTCGNAAGNYGGVKALVGTGSPPTVVAGYARNIRKIILSNDTQDVWAPITFLVPNGYNYRLDSDNSSGTCTLQEWFEMLI